MPTPQPAQRVSTASIMAWTWVAVAAFLAVRAVSHGSWVGGLLFAGSALAACTPYWMRSAANRANNPIAARWMLGIVGVLGGALISSLPDNAIQDGASDQTDISAAKGDACGAEGQVTQRDYAVTKEAVLRSGPDPKAEPLIFAIGSDAKPVSIDDSMPVREVCRAKGWSEVRVMMFPSDIGKAQGWVPSSVLRTVPVNDAGRRVYREADIEWPTGSKSYRTAALTVVNRLVDENPKCDAINTRSLLVRKDGDGAKLHVVCFGKPEQSVDFRPADATNGRSFVPIEPTTQDVARRVCEAGALQRTMHPSTADFAIMSADFATRTDGTSTYKTTFTAKNGFNLELKFRVECELTGEDLTSVDVFEAGG